MTDPLVETWEINSRINIFLLKALKPDDLSVTPAGKGRTVADLLSHVHNVRLMWLKSSEPDLLEGLVKVEAGSSPSLAVLERSLAESGEAIARLIANAVVSGGRIKGFKPHATAFVGYLISHESHHRGQVAAGLRSAGRPLDKKTSYGLWEWGVR